MAWNLTRDGIGVFLVPVCILVRDIPARMESTTLVYTHHRLNYRLELYRGNATFIRSIKFNTQVNVFGPSNSTLLSLNSLEGLLGDIFSFDKLFN